MNHPLCPVRHTDDEKYCRTVNQPSRLHRTVLTPNFNIEFSSLARQSFVHCTFSEHYFDKAPMICRKLDIDGRVVDVQCGEGAVYRCWPKTKTRELTRSSSHLPTILLGTLYTHNGIVMLELICHRLRHCSHCILMPYSSDDSAEINQVLVFEWMVER